jgi:Zn-dependent protease with chaperone function
MLFTPLWEPELFFKSNIMISSYAATWFGSAGFVRCAIVLFLLLGLLTHAEAQDFNHYRQLRSSSPLPLELLTPSSEKYKTEIAQIDRKDVGRRDARGRTTFALESNFVIDQMLRSGMVLFNDPVGRYLQEIVDKIKTANPEIDQDLRVYTLRSTAVNAFATDRGSIFVTLGLVARVQTEAQLAFILCHEIVHVRKDHSLDMFLTVEAIERDTERRRALRESTFDRTLVEKNNYSKELEMEADEEGYQLFSRVGYSTESIQDVYDVLKYSYLPLANLPLNRDFLGAGKIAFPPTYWLDSVRTITGTDEDEDNPLSTHPSLSTRRAKLAEAMAQTRVSDGKDYLVSEERFLHLKKVARYELPMLHFEEMEIPEGIYTSYLLMQDDSSAYLQKCLVKGLYVIAKFKEGLRWEVTDFEDELEGELQQVHAVVRSLDDKEAVVLALRHAWDAHRRFPEDKEIKAMTDDLFSVLPAYVDDLEGFYAVDNPFGQADSTREHAEGGLASRNLDSLAEAYGREFWRAAFKEDKNDQAFAAAFNRGVDAFKKQKAASNKTGRGKRFGRSSRSSGKGRNSGIKKIVAVTPFYLKLDERKNFEVQYLDTERGQFTYREVLEEAAAAAKLDLQVLDYSGLGTEDAHVLNNISLLNSWFAEQVGYEEISKTLGLQQGLIDSLAKVYDTDHFLWSGVITLRAEERIKGLKVLMSVFWPPLAPFFIAELLVPDYNMLYFSLLINVKSLEKSTINYTYYNKRDSQSMLKAHVYDSMLRIRSR